MLEIPDRKKEFPLQVFDRKPSICGLEILCCLVTDLDNDAWRALVNYEVGCGKFALPRNLRDHLELEFLLYEKFFCSRMDKTLCQYKQNAEVGCSSIESPLDMPL